MPKPSSIAPFTAADSRVCFASMSPAELRFAARPQFSASRVTHLPKTTLPMRRRIWVRFESGKCLHLVWVGWRKSVRLVISVPSCLPIFSLLRNLQKSSSLDCHKMTRQKNSWVCSGSGSFASE